MSSFDMSVWEKTSFSQDDRIDEYFIPHWPCPYCEATLILHDKLTDIPLKPYCEVDVCTFFGHLSCPRCELLISISGWMEYSQIDQKLNGDPIYYREYNPKLFLPNLKMFTLEKYYPKDISKILDKAFSLYFYDIFATALYIRCVLEKMLDEKEFGAIPRIDDKGEEIFLGFRIEKITDVKIKSKFKAIKFIGNAGAHFDEMKLTQDDVLQAFNIMHFLLEEKYSPRITEMDITVERINKNKGGGVVN